ncbi:MAG: DHHA1 domain-containing protein, partial [Microcystaceae cyanobacterium]
QNSEFRIDLPPHLARGSARSVNNIDLYQLIESQLYLLHQFGGHPLAAGLSLPVPNIPLFRDAINQQLRQQSAGGILMKSRLEADLIVTVSELGKTLFRELKLLEPYGMGNPVPKLLIQNCWFDRVWHNKAQDLRGNKVQYIRTTFNIWDDTVSQGFPGIWWGHYKEELPQNKPCDVMVELDFNPHAYNFETKTHETRYEVRLIAVKARCSNTQVKTQSLLQKSILDWRSQSNLTDNSFFRIQNSEFRILESCPTSWDEIQVEYRQALVQKTKLALAYPPPNQQPPQQIWQQLIGITKYLSRTGKTIMKEQLQEKLGLGDRTLSLGLQSLINLGFNCQIINQSIGIT